MKLRDILKENELVLVEFGAAWCGPCHSMKPILEELRNRIGDKALVLEVDVDKEPRNAKPHNIFSLPTIILFKNGVEKWKRIGVRSSDEMEKAIAKYL